MPISGGLQLATVSGFAPFSEDVPVSIATCETHKTFDTHSPVIAAFPDNGPNSAICHEACR
jgi:hypothetical protein